MEIEKFAAYLNIAVVVILAALYFICLGQSLSAALMGLRVSPLQIIFMKLRKTDVNLFIKNLAKVTKGNLPVANDEIETHMIIGGDISNVINGMLYAKAHGIPLTFQEAAKLDMRKHDVISHLKENSKEMINS